MTFKSEAQAYQAIRHDIKKKMRSSQRSLTYAKWALDNNGEQHPIMKKLFILKFRGDYNLPKISQEDSEKRIFNKSGEISDLQMFLDRYKV